MLPRVPQFPEWRHYHLIWVRARLPHASELFHHGKCGRVMGSGEGSGGGEQVVAADSKHGLQRHSRHISRNITRDNLWCHLSDVSLERSPTNNNILLILSTILATSSHPPTNTHTHTHTWAATNWKMLAAMFAKHIHVCLFRSRSGRVESRAGWERWELGV